MVTMKDWYVDKRILGVPPVLRHKCNQNVHGLVRCKLGKWMCTRCYALPPEEIQFVAELANCSTLIDK